MLIFSNITNKRSLFSDLKQLWLHQKLSPCASKGQNIQFKVSDGGNSTSGRWSGAFISCPGAGASERPIIQLHNQAPLLSLGLKADSGDRIDPLRITVNKKRLTCMWQREWEGGRTFPLSNTETQPTGFDCSLMKPILLTMLQPASRIRSIKVMQHRRKERLWIIYWGKIWNFLDTAPLAGGLERKLAPTFRPHYPISPFPLVSR